MTLRDAGIMSAFWVPGILLAFVAYLGSRDGKVKRGSA